MKIKIKITQRVYESILFDLMRPHPFAEERVGFISSKVGNRNGETLLVFLNDYMPVPDENYVPDDFVGARIDSAAIRSVMQQIFTTKDGVFHVHLHSHREKPSLSYTDRLEIPPLVESFRNVAPNAVHGILLLSVDKAFASVIPPQKTGFITETRISVIGRNLRLLKV